MHRRTVFLWQWENHPPQPDALMTRARAARLIRAWRRASRSPANYGPTTALRRTAPHTYRAIHRQSGEVGTLTVITTPAGA